MTDATVVGWESLGIVAGAFALAVWALREPNVAKPASAGVGPLSARFQLRSKRGMSTVVDLANGAILGRGGDCSAALDDPTVSKRHARVGFDGKPWLEDLESTNGTFVNGRRIAGSTWIRRGDRIALGAAKLVFLGLVPRGTSGSKG